MNSFFDAEYLQKYVNERSTRIISDLDLREWQFGTDPVAHGNVANELMGGYLCCAAAKLELELSRPEVDALIKSKLEQVIARGDQSTWPFALCFRAACADSDHDGLW